MSAHNPQTIYKDAVSEVLQMKVPQLTTVRDRNEVYNARRTDHTITDEYLAVMKQLEKQNEIVTRFSMSPAEASVLVLGQEHLIKEIKQCCLIPAVQFSRSVLCKFLRMSILY